MSSRRVPQRGGNYFAVLADDDDTAKAPFMLGPSRIGAGFSVFDETRAFHASSRRDGGGAGVDADVDCGAHSALNEFGELVQGSANDKLTISDVGAAASPAAAAAGVAAAPVATAALSAIRAKFGGATGGEELHTFFPTRGGAGGAAADDAPLDVCAVLTGLPPASAFGARVDGASDIAWDFSGLGSSAVEVARKAAADAAAAAAAAAMPPGSTASRIRKIAADDSGTVRDKMAKQELTHKQRVRRIVEAQRGAQFADRFSARVKTQGQKVKMRNKVKGKDI